MWWWWFYTSIFTKNKLNTIEKIHSIGPKEGPKPYGNSRKIAKSQRSLTRRTTTEPARSDRTKAETHTVRMKTENGKKIRLKARLEPQIWQPKSKMANHLLPIFQTRTKVRASLKLNTWSLLIEGKPRTTEWQKKYGAVHEGVLFSMVDTPLHRK